MKGKVTIYLIVYLVLFILLNACSAKEVAVDEAYKEEYIKVVQYLEKENKDLKEKVEALESVVNKPLHLLYVEVEEHRRFVEYELPLYILPQEGFMPLSRTISAKTVVEVLDRVMTSDGKGPWLYVQIPAYDSPMDMKGWILEEKTLPYIEEHQKILTENVLVLAGTEVFRADIIDEVTQAPTEILPYQQNCGIGERKSGYVSLFCGGGSGFIVLEENIIYPEIEGPQRFIIE